MRRFSALEFDPLVSDLVFGEQQMWENHCCFHCDVRNWCYFYYDNSCWFGNSLNWRRIYPLFSSLQSYGAVKEEYAFAVSKEGVEYS